MSYESTDVSVIKSQGSISSLVVQHGGTGIGFESEPPYESVTAKIKIGGIPYVVRISASCRMVPREIKRRGAYYATRRTDEQMAAATEQERRRVWRVLYWHLKAIFDAADAGVVELRQAMLAYVVMPDGQTVGEKIIPRLDEAVAGGPLLLPEKTK